jgi:PAS domain S-box-containing protein
LSRLIHGTIVGEAWTPRQANRIKSLLAVFARTPMTDRAFNFNDASDPRLAGHALSEAPVWLWSVDGSRVLWANPSAAAAFNASSPSALAARRFDAAHPAAVRIARLAETVPFTEKARLERLRGLGGGPGTALTCLCSQIKLGDGTAAILVVAAEQAGPPLPLSERVRRLISDTEAPVAAFSADGALIEATAAALELLGGRHHLASLGAQTLAEAARTTGNADGEIAGVRARIDRLGAGTTVVLLATFNEQSPKQTTIAAERRLPLRFIWQVDCDGIFTIMSDEFVRLAGAPTSTASGKPWPEAAASLGFGADNPVSRALATRQTWSDVRVQWPVEGEREPLAVELSGLPVFAPDSGFGGYRGFGLCRDVGRLTALNARRALAVSAASNLNPQSETAAFKNVLRFPPVGDKETIPALSPGEHRAFDELARELVNRLQSGAATEAGRNQEIREPKKAAGEKSASPQNVQESRPILDRLPTGILVYRLNTLMYANRAFLDWTGYPTLEALAEAGGLDSLFIEPGAESADGANTLTISTQEGHQLPVEGKLFSITWNGENALALMLNASAGGLSDQQKNSELTLRRAETEIRELKAILDTATDGVLIIDGAGRVLSANRSAEALFGYDKSDFSALTFVDLFAAESRPVVMAYLNGLTGEHPQGLPDGGKEVFGRVQQGGRIPLFITLGRLGEHADKFCVVLRDITAWKKAEDELLDAKRRAERAALAKTDFLTGMSHEIRTPLNAIIGFSEVMLDERFGPIGNEQYRQYLRDIHASGSHLISLLNDLLDLSKIEAGKLELNFIGVSLNDVTQQCVAIMQQQANRERVIVRTSLSTTLPQVLADVRSLRQIVLNLLSNSIRLAGAGGQVIVSTALTDGREAVLRVRQTGAGMNEEALQAALEPFRGLASDSLPNAVGTGLQLPITKALTEANHAQFSIKSAVNDGTLAEVIFPPGRLLA